jgi:hypothetical protein
MSVREKFGADPIRGGLFVVPSFGKGGLLLYCHAAKVVNINPMRKIPNTILPFEYFLGLF